MLADAGGGGEAAVVGLQLRVRLHHEIGVEPVSQFQQRLDLAEVVVHQDGHDVDALPRVATRFREGFDGGDGPVKRPLAAALGVVSLGVAVVEADTYAPAPGGEDFAGQFGRRSPAVGGHEREVVLGDGVDDVHDVVAHQRFAAGEADEDRPEVGQATTGGAKLLEREFFVAPAGRSPVIAERALQVAAISDLPGDPGRMAAGPGAEQPRLFCQWSGPRSGRAKLGIDQCQFAHEPSMVSGNAYGFRVHF